MSGTRAGELDTKFEEVAAHLRKASAQAVRDAYREERNPRKTLELASTAVQLFELATQLAQQAVYPDGSPIACKQGCSWCCYQMVTTTPPLALCMMRGLEGGLSPTDRGVMLERTRAVHRAVRGKSAQERRELRVACPLVNGDGSCMAHAARPLACRGWNSHDADACRKAIDEPRSLPSAKVFVPSFRFAQAVEDGLGEGLAAMGLQAGPVELVGALLVAFEDQDTQERWLRGEHVFDEDLPAEGHDAAATWIADSEG